MPAKGIYIYGIVPNLYSTDIFRSLENSEVYAISFQNISAIVSERESAHIDFLDRESLGRLLVHHQKTIEEIMGKGFAMFIPMKLGTVFSSKKDAIKILENGHDLIINTLKKIEYLTEIDLAVSWADFPATINDIAADPEIIAMKDDILIKTDTHLKIDQVKAGMLVQKKLIEKNKQIELNILDSLTAYSIDIKIHDVFNDQMITNSAFLINRDKKDKFEQAIDKLDEEFNSALNFKIVGPLPCYSFYTLEVKKLNVDHVLLAKNELGLGEETSESEIKKAYLEKAKLFHPDAQMENGDEENFNRISKAYHTMLDYSASARQSSNMNLISLTKENVIENLILVKIKE